MARLLVITLPMPAARMPGWQSLAGPDPGRADFFCTIAAPAIALMLASRIIQRDAGAA